MARGLREAEAETDSSASAPSADSDHVRADETALCSVHKRRRRRQHLEESVAGTGVWHCRSSAPCAKGNRAVTQGSWACCLCSNYNGEAAQKCLRCGARRTGASGTAPKGVDSALVEQAVTDVIETVVSSGREASRKRGVPLETALFSCRSPLKQLLQSLYVFVIDRLDAATSRFAGDSGAELRCLRDQMRQTEEQRDEWRRRAAELEGAASQAQNEQDRLREQVETRDKKSQDDRSSFLAEILLLRQRLRNAEQGGEDGGVPSQLSQHLLDLVEGASFPQKQQQQQPAAQPPPSTPLLQADGERVTHRPSFVGTGRQRQASRMGPLPGRQGRVSVFAGGQQQQQQQQQQQPIELGQHLSSQLGQRFLRTSFAFTERRASAASEEPSLSRAASAGFDLVVSGPGEGAGDAKSQAGGDAGADAVTLEAESAAGDEEEEERSGSEASAVCAPGSTAQADQRIAMLLRERNELVRTVADLRRQLEGLKMRLAMKSVRPAWKTTGTSSPLAAKATPTAAYRPPKLVKAVSRLFRRRRRRSAPQIDTGVLVSPLSAASDGPREFPKSHAEQNAVDTLLQVDDPEVTVAAEAAAATADEAVTSPAATSDAAGDRQHTVPVDNLEEEGSAAGEPLLPTSSPQPVRRRRRSPPTRAPPEPQVVPPPTDPPRQPSLRTSPRGERAVGRAVGQAGGKVPWTRRRSGGKQREAGGQAWVLEGRTMSASPPATQRPASQPAPAAADATSSDGGNAELPVSPVKHRPMSALCPGDRQRWRVDDRAEAERRVAAAARVLLSHATNAPKVADRRGRVAVSMVTLSGGPAPEREMAPRPPSAPAAERSVTPPFNRPATSMSAASAPTVAGDSHSVAAAMYRRQQQHHKWSRQNRKFTTEPRVVGQYRVCTPREPVPPQQPASRSTRVRKSSARRLVQCAKATVCEADDSPRKVHPPEWVSKQSPRGGGGWYASAAGVPRQKQPPDPHGWVPRTPTPTSSAIAQQVPELDLRKIMLAQQAAPADREFITVSSRVALSSSRGQRAARTVRITPPPAPAPPDAEAEADAEVSAVNLRTARGDDEESEAEESP